MISGIDMSSGPENQGSKWSTSDLRNPMYVRTNDGTPVYGSVKLSSMTAAELWDRNIADVLTKRH